MHTAGSAGRGAGWMTVAACLGASEATPHVWWWQGAGAAGADGQSVVAAVRARSEGGAETALSGGGRGRRAALLSRKLVLASSPPAPPHAPAERRRTAPPAAARHAARGGQLLWHLSPPPHARARARQGSAVVGSIIRLFGRQTAGGGGKEAGPSHNNARAPCVKVTKLASAHYGPIILRSCRICSLFLRFPHCPDSELR